MSEEILKALMQLFAIIVKQDEGVEESEIKYVKNFLDQQLNSEAVEEFFSLFKNKAGVKTKEDDGKKKKLKLTSVRDSVRILGICKKINKMLNQQQKVVVLVRLFELVNSDRKFSDQRMAIINTVAEVFNISKEEFESIENFVIQNEVSKLDNSGILIINDKNNECKSSRQIKSEAIDGNIFILHINSADLYFLRYTGSQDVFLNGLPLNNRRIYLFSIGSTIRLPKGKPIYYSDVVSKYLADTSLTKLSLTVDNVSYHFPSGDIGLRNISFSEEHGKLIGIMGASGAGKTTMLNVLSGMSTPSVGEIRINNINLHKHPNKIKGIIGYIPQDDLLIEELTVFQNLYYNAKQCFNNKTNDEIIALVDKTLSNLGLLKIKNLKVGSPLNKTISGGQRKRLNIALELIREPSILFVDEPTSGLSSRDSENVMDLLSELTLKGKLIFVVIHQPSSDIYKMFDKMIILDTGGYMIYHGNPVEAIVYFKILDNQINSEVGECPTCGNVNPELIFNIIEAKVVDEFGRYTNTRKVVPTEWEEHFRNSVELEKVNEVKDAPPSSLSIPTWLKQMKIFAIRDFIAKISNTQYILLNLLEAPLLAFMLAFIIRYIADPKSGIYIFRENVNFPPYIFMSIVVALFLGLMVSAEEIFKDRKILKREKFLNLSRSSYLISKISILLGISAIQSILFVIVGNWILGIQEMNFYYWFALFSIAASSNLLGLNISASFNSVVTIYILIPLLMIPQMVLGGAMFSFDKLNSLIGGAGEVPLVAEFMPSRWVYEAIMVKQYKDNEFEKIFFDLEKAESVANFKTVHYIPELKARLDSVNNKFNTDQKSVVYFNNLELLYNELAKEQRKLKRRENLIIQHIEIIKETSIDNNGQQKQLKNQEKALKTKLREIHKLSHPTSFKLSKLTPDSFSIDVAEYVEEYIDDLNSFYNSQFGEVNSKIDKIKSEWNQSDPEMFMKQRKAYHNQALTEIVKKIYEEKPIIEYNNELVQQIQPIYLEPDNKNIFNFRTHFYAPKKFFLGTYFDTFWFNMVIIWLFSIVLYITLYYEHLSKLMNVLGKIDFMKLFKKLTKKRK